MSVTGYERQLFADVRRIADNLEDITRALLDLRDEHKRIRLEAERQTNLLEERNP